MKSSCILFVKEGCPWCIEALEFFESRKFKPSIVNVSGDPHKLALLEKISGQRKTPTLQYKDFVVADFSIDEFLEAVKSGPDELKKIFF